LKRQRGVTLIEALVAAVVMGAGLLALLQAHLSLHGQAESARLRRQALVLAQRELEALRAAPAPPTSDASLDDGVFSLQRRTADAGAGLRAVQLRVAWIGRDGAEDAVTLHTLLAAPDPGFSGTLALAVPALSLRSPSPPAAAAFTTP
jgi:type II secretory pathway pseudopilin PulG